MKKKIAVYTTEWGSEAISECCGYLDGLGWTRITEPLEVDFVPRPEHELNPELVAKIDAEIEKISDKFMKELNQLKQKKAELLAITDQSAVAV